MNNDELYSRNHINSTEQILKEFNEFNQEVEVLDLHEDDAHATDSRRDFDFEYFSQG